MATELTNPSTEVDDLDDELSLRDTLDAAFDQAATDEATEAKPATTGRARDPGGRFAANTDTLTDPNATATTTTEGVAAALSGAAQGQQVQPGGQLGQQQAAPEMKAPVTWTPQAREKWAAVDPDIKAEIHRREGEANRLVQTAAQHRQFVDAFQQLMQPYEMFIRAENSNPLAAVDNMMRTAAQLRVGTPAAKVEIVAGIIKNFGIDLPALDAMLAGQQPQYTAQQPQQYRDPRVDQMLAQQNYAQQQHAQFESQSIQQGLNQFAQGHEFYGDVAHLMADLVEVQTRQGIAVDLEQVYKRACQMHDGVSTILSSRATANTNGGNSRAVLRAKRAAASLKGDSTPHSGATVPKGDSVRAAIEAAMDSVGDD